MAKRTRKQVSDVLRAKIKASDMNAAQIAEKAGISPIMIGRFVRGERDLRLATVDKIADVLNLELRDKAK